MYHPHDDTIRQPCRMGDKQAAIRAVAFTATDTGAPPIRQWTAGQWSEAIA